MDNKTAHLTDDQLAALALGHTGTGTAAHLGLCAACRAEASVYRSIVQSTREVFCDEFVPVELVCCEQMPSSRGTFCEAIDPAQQLHISLTRINGMLYGQVTAEEEACDTLHDAPVRLFDGEGLVSSGQLTATGDFALAVPDPARRYSLGLVLPRQGVPELTIVGQSRRQ